MQVRVANSILAKTISKGELYMANQPTIAPHEILELHEMLSGDLVVAKKLQLMIPMVQDGDLKNLMQQTLQKKKMTIDQIEEFYNNHTNFSKQGVQ